MVSKTFPIVFATGPNSIRNTSIEVHTDDEGGVRIVLPQGYIVDFEYGTALALTDFLSQYLTE